MIMMMTGNLIQQQQQWLNSYNNNEYIMSCKRKEMNGLKEQEQRKPMIQLRINVL